MVAVGGFLVACGAGQRSPDPDETEGALGGISSSPATEAGSSSGSTLSPPDIADPPPPPIVGGTLLLSRDGERFFVGDEARDLVHVVDIDDRIVVASVDVPNCHPGRMAEADDGALMVLCRAAGTLLSIDADTGAVTETLETCSNPRGLALDPEGSAWVACAQGQVLQFQDGARVSTVEVGVELRDILDVGPPLRVSTFREAQVLTLAEDGSVMDTQAPAEVAVLGESEPETLVLNPNDPVPADAVGPLFPNVARRTAASPTGGWTMLHQVARPPAAGIVPTGDFYRDGCVGSQNAAVSWTESATSEVNTRVYPAMGVAFDAAFDLDSGRVAVVGAVETDWVLVLDEEFEGTFTVLPSCNVLGQRSLDGPASAVAFDGEGRVWVLGWEPSELRIFDDDEPGRVVLSNLSVADTGHQLFHRPTRGSVACASCHPEGREDGRLWALDNDAPRRTMSLAGRIEGGAPFQWQGNFENFAALDAEIRLAKMNGIDWPADYVDALEGWLFSIPPMRPANDLEAASVEQGAQAFSELGCITCHQEPRYDNPQSVAFGERAVLQVPSLLGARYGAPYMHDGRAADLEAAIEDMLVNAAVPVKATAQQREALLAFLMSL